MFLIKEHRYKVNLRDVNHVICFQSMLRKAMQSMDQGYNSLRYVGYFPGWILSLTLCTLGIR